MFEVISSGLFNELPGLPRLVGQFLDILSNGHQAVAAGVHVEATQGLATSLHQPPQLPLERYFEVLNTSSAAPGKVF